MDGGDVIPVSLLPCPAQLVLWGPGLILNGYYRTFSPPRSRGPTKCLWVTLCHVHVLVTLCAWLTYDTLSVNEHLASFNCTARKRHLS